MLGSPKGCSAGPYADPRSAYCAIAQLTQRWMDSSCSRGGSESSACGDSIMSCWYANALFCDRPGTGMNNPPPVVRLWPLGFLWCLRLRCKLCVDWDVCSGMFQGHEITNLCQRMLQIRPCDTRRHPGNTLRPGSLSMARGTPKRASFSCSFDSVTFVSRPSLRYVFRSAHASASST